jgi:peroxiredoxin Q/BCP
VRETLADFEALDTIPFGVNQADAVSHQAFIDELKLPFDLLIDEGLAVSRVYDAVKPDADRIQRTVVIVGKDGKILFRAQGAPPPGELLEAIAKAKD